MLVARAYKAEHDENRMAHEGDVDRARTHYLSGATANLKFLLKNRFEWMNRYIKPTDRGVEVGCGTGVSKDFIRCREYLITDYTDKPWLDVKNVDALSTPFKNGEFDFVVSSNMIHHVPYPIRFFEEMHRILKPGGSILIQEINASLMMRLVLRLMRHEGYSFEPNVFDRNLICTDPNDLWSANCAIPNLLFDDVQKFERYVPKFKVVRSSFSEFFTFLNSGGVIAKTKYVPLPKPLLTVEKGVDDLLATVLPSVFALQRQVVLQRRS